MTPTRILPGLALLLAATLDVDARDWESADSPFRLGEAYPEVPATCATIKDWIDHAPDTDDRVSLGIVGEVSSIDWDGALAYLVMCEQGGVQVMCVTYSKDGVNVGDRVLFGGGYSRAGEAQIMLDPCLASDPGQ